MERYATVSPDYQQVLDNLAEGLMRDRREQLTRLMAESATAAVVPFPRPEFVPDIVA